MIRRLGALKSLRDAKDHVVNGKRSSPVVEFAAPHIGEILFGLRINGEVVEMILVTLSKQAKMKRIQEHHSRLKIATFN